MSDIILECHGLPCPQPVLRCKKVIEESSPASLKAIVDNEAAKDNVSRFLTVKGYTVEISEEKGSYTLSASKSDAEICEACETLPSGEIAAMAGETQQKITVFVGSDVVGSGDDELGGKLMLNFLATLPELGEELWRIVMVNAGVKLACKGHPCLEKLQDLEKAGADLLVCGTCLEHFDLMKDKQVGETTNMLDVVTSLQLASKVIRP